MEQRPAIEEHIDRTTAPAPACSICRRSDRLNRVVFSTGCYARNQWDAEAKNTQ